MPGRDERPTKAAAFVQPAPRFPPGAFLSVEPGTVFQAIVHRSAEAAGLEINVTPHTFCRSCTTELIRGGANVYHAKELLGHENLETLKHYTKLTIEDLKATHARCHPRERNEDA